MTIDADKLVAVYIKMRDERDRLTREHETALEALKTQMEVIEQSLLDLCKTNGQDGGKTRHGTFTRTVRTRYWTSNWDAMRQFIRDHDALDLMELRLHRSQDPFLEKDGVPCYQAGIPT